MEPQAIFGFVLLAIVLVTGAKIFKEFFKGMVLIVLALIAGFLIVGGMPELGQVPVVGDLFVPDVAGQMPADGSVESVILAVKDIAWSVDISTISTDSSGGVLIAVTNTGQLPLSEFDVSINGDAAEIKNTLPAELKKGESAIIQTGYSGFGFVEVKIVSGEAEAETVFHFPE